MGREHIEFIDSNEVPWRPASLPGLDGGACKRVLSEDPESGAATLMVELPAGWRREAIGHYSASEELFVLRGDLTVGSEQLSDGCYTYIPRGMAHGPLASREGRLALVMFEGRPEFVEREDSDPESATGQYIPRLNTARMPWNSPSLEGPPPGILIKVLRADPKTGDRTWVAAVVPFWREGRAEVHPTVEEAFMLKGETLLGERGIMQEGCHFWRLPNVPHGPLVTKTGGTWFFRTKGGSLDVTYTEPPNWERQVDKYLSNGPLFTMAVE